MASTSKFRQLINSQIPTNNQKQISASSVRRVLEESANSIDGIFDTISIANGLGVYNATTGVATISETGVTYTPVELANQVNGKYFDVVVSGTQSITGESVVMEVGGIIISRGTTWDYIPKSSLALVKAINLEGKVAPTQTLGFYSLTPTSTSFNATNKVCLNQRQYVSMKGVVRRLRVKTQTATGSVNLLILRKNVAGTAYEEISRHLVALGTIGNNDVDVSSMNIQVLKGDTYALQFAGAGPDIRTNSTASSGRSLTTLIQAGTVSVPTAQIEATLGGVIDAAFVFELDIEGDFAAQTTSDLSVINGQVTTNAAGVLNHEGRVSSLESTVSTIASSVIEYQDELVVKNAFDTNNGWDLTSFSGWAIGMNHLTVEHMTKLRMVLSRIPTNEKLVLKVYSRPVADTASATFPGSHVNDVLLQTKEYLTSGMIATAGFQTVDMLIDSLLIDTTKIYLFHVKGVLAGGGVGTLGTDRHSVATAGLAPWQRGWYANSPAPDTTTNIGSGANFVVSYSVFMSRPVDLVAEIKEKSDDSADQILTRMANKSFAKGIQLYKNALSALPARWTAVNWSASGGGLSPSATGLANYLKFNDQYAASRRKASVKVKLFADTRFMFFTKNVEGAVNQGTLTEIDVAAAKIRIYKAFTDAGALPALKIDAACTIVSGREYLVELFAIEEENRLVVTDTLTGDSVSVSDNTLNGVSADATGRQYDCYAFCNYSGTAPIVRDFRVSCLQPVNPVLYICGDSITAYRYGATVANGYAYRLAALLGVPVVISGRGGGTIAGVLNRLETEVKFLKPTYVMISIGTNGGNTILNLTQAVNRIIELGAIPILNNVPRHSNGSDVAVNAIIETVRSTFGLSGALFNVATSIGKVVANGQDLTIFNNDGGVYLHPTSTGSAEMAKRFPIDTPELFD